MWTPSQLFLNAGSVIQERNKARRSDIRGKSYKDIIKCIQCTIQKHLSSKEPYLTEYGKAC